MCLIKPRQMKEFELVGMDWNRDRIAKVLRAASAKRANPAVTDAPNGREYLEDS